nr:MAG TPA: Oxaloacetate decarboxylase, gamma chain [Caudoviricetes sp.]
MAVFFGVLLVLWILSYGFTSILRAIGNFILTLFGR